MKAYKLLAPLLPLLAATVFFSSGQTNRTPQSDNRQPSGHLLALVRNGPVPLIDIASLTSRSTLVAVAEIESVSDQGRFDQSGPNCGGCGVQHQMLAALHLKRVIYGQPNGSDVKIKFLLREQPNGLAEYSGLDTGAYKLFFLQSDIDQNYVFADEFHPFLVAVRESPAELIGGTTYDHVISEMTNVLKSTQAASSDRVRAISALEKAKTHAAIVSLQRAAEDSDVTVRFQAMASLFRHNDIKKLSAAIDIIMNPPAGVEGYLVDNLGASISARVSEPAAIPGLTRLLESPKVEHRRIAVEALNRTGRAGRGALTKALNDDDQRVRYAAVTGLATITGETEGIPSLELFQKNEQHYLDHWRERMRKKKN